MSTLVRKTYYILFALMLLCVACEWRLKPNDATSDDGQVSIERYDRVEHLYLSTGDRAALQQMNTSYPMQTRMLIEDVLCIGKVNDPEINRKFLYFFQDSTLQVMLSDVQRQYEDISDLDMQLSDAFRRLRKELPNVDIPLIYTQIGSFDQSIVVGHKTLGISLDKYLGADYPFYQDHYTERQRRMMSRAMIVPDCLGFYLLSLFPMPDDRELQQQERDIHMGKIQWVVNLVTDTLVFDNDHVAAVERYMKHHKGQPLEHMLGNTNFAEFREL